MNMKRLHILFLFAAFIGGYLTSTFLAGRGSLAPPPARVSDVLTHETPSPGKKMRTTASERAQQPRRAAEPNVRFTANRESAAVPRPTYRSPPAETASSAEAAFFIEPLEEELFAELLEHERIAQEEELERALAVEQERIALEHVMGQGDDMADSSVAELNGVALKQLQLDLEAAIDEEMELQRFDQDANDPDPILYYAAPTYSVGQELSEIMLEDQRLAIEGAIEREMGLLETGGGQ